MYIGLKWLLFMFSSIMARLQGGVVFEQACWKLSISGQKCHYLTLVALSFDFSYKWHYKNSKRLRKTYNPTKYDTQESMFSTQSKCRVSSRGKYTGLKKHVSVIIIIPTYIVRKFKYWSLSRNVTILLRSLSLWQWHQDEVYIENSMP